MVEHPRGKGVLKRPRRVKDEADTATKRKLIAFDDDVFAALQLLARDSMNSFQELADEAFADLLKKHDRPVVLEDALRQSLRAIPANDHRRQHPAKSSKTTSRRLPTRA